MSGLRACESECTTIIPYVYVSQEKLQVYHGISIPAVTNIVQKTGRGPASYGDIWRFEIYSHQMFTIYLLVGIPCKYMCTT